jgi:SAM-dependent methyltransferase
MNEAERQVAALDAFQGGGIYGLQWGSPDSDAHLVAVRDGFLLDNLRPGMSAVEIGAGGGRWSRYFVGRVARALLVDATPASERAIRAHCDWPGFEFVVSHDGSLPRIPDDSIDFAFSFDTFVHFEPTLFDGYLAQLGRVLKPRAKLVLHYAKRWPECEQDERCFRYRQDAEVERVCGGVELVPTGRNLELRCGFGSVVREFRKEAIPAPT